MPPGLPPDRLVLCVITRDAAQARRPKSQQKHTTKYGMVSGKTGQGELKNRFRRRLTPGKIQPARTAFTNAPVEVAANNPRQGRWQPRGCVIFGCPTWLRVSADGHVAGNPSFQPIRKPPPCSSVARIAITTMPMITGMSFFIRRAPVGALYGLRLMMLYGGVSLAE